MWDERFSTEDYVFGTAPAAFLADHSAYLTPGTRTLAVADGEGRNSVFMAERGLDVVAMDASPVGLQKAQALAATRGVSVDFRQSDIATWDWDGEVFDLVVAVFIQFMDPVTRATAFAGMKRCLKPGGVLMLHGFTPKQLEYRTGGPGNVDFLYTEALLRDAFGALEIERLQSHDRVLDEGPGHSGLSALIDLVARKPD